MNIVASPSLIQRMSLSPYSVPRAYWWQDTFAAIYPVNPASSPSLIQRSSLSPYSIPGIWWRHANNPATIEIPLSVVGMASVSPQATLTWNMGDQSPQQAGYEIRHTYVTPSIIVTLTIVSPWAGKRILELQHNIILPAITSEMLRWLSTGLNQDGCSNWAKILTIWAFMQHTSDAVIASIPNTYSILTAAGSNLDRLAISFGLRREFNESDTSFRNRITVITSLHNGGTITDIQAYVGMALGINPERIKILEHFAISPPAIFTVRLLSNPTILRPWSDIDTLIRQIKPAGVKYISSDYIITSEWVSGATGWGYDSWDTTRWS